ncbi:MAG TPA: hypothetical protein VM677_15890 [Actinokineospora sp.]|nr:hypothetical protein [Actinokineospora sp.]
MGNLVVTFNGVRRTLSPADTLTFGRDPSCTVSFGRDDRTISRRMGMVRCQNDVWFIINLSAKRALDISDANGFSVPLPISSNGVPSIRAVDQAQLTVKIAGADADHELLLVPQTNIQPVDAVPPTDPMSTFTHRPSLTDNRREVLVAMARGYLRGGAHHDPNPLTYADVAHLLGLSQTTVMRRVQVVREQLIADGVGGLQVSDARRPLCEWLLRMRWISPDDLDWLQPRIDAARRRRNA